MEVEWKGFLWEYFSSTYKHLFSHNLGIAMARKCVKYHFSHSEFYTALLLSIFLVRPVFLKICQI